jgi:hypothetical protein
LELEDFKQQKEIHEQTQRRIGARREGCPPKIEIELVEEEEPPKPVQQGK